MTLEQVLEFIESNKDNENAIRDIELATRPHIMRYRAIKKGVSTEVAQVKKKDSKVLAGSSAVAKGLDIEASAIANELWREVKSRYEWVKEENMRKWAEDIEKIHRIDKFDYVTIMTVMRWSQQDDFWQQNIRSGANLRKHFDKLLIKTKKFVDNSRVDTV